MEIICNLQSATLLHLSEKISLFINQATTTSITTSLEKICDVSNFFSFGKRHDSGIKPDPMNKGDFRLFRTLHDVTSKCYVLNYCSTLIQKISHDLPLEIPLNSLKNWSKSSSKRFWNMKFFRFWSVPVLSIAALFLARWNLSKLHL